MKKYCEWNTKTETKKEWTKGMRAGVRAKVRLSHPTQHSKPLLLPQKTV